MAAQILTTLHVVTLLVVCFVTRAALDHKLVNVTCSQHCHCYTDTNHKISAKCDLNGLNSSSLARIHWPKELFSLDLSSNGLKKIPVSFLRKLSNISSLILTNNSLEDMKNDSFSELKQLHTLDLSYSKIRSLGKGLSKLENLFVKQAYLSLRWFWRELLTLPSIKFIAGVALTKRRVFPGYTWTDRCDCNIIRAKRSNLLLHLCHKNPESPCRYLKPESRLQCTCNLMTANVSPLYARQRFFDCLYPLASVGLLLNSVVIYFVPTCKDLRKSPTMLLILNMAVCDLFMGLWCVLTSKFNLHVDIIDMFQIYWHTPTDRSSFDLMCPWMTFIFAVAQLTSVMTSLFLTVERYLVIVYSMNPGMRMTGRLAAICVCTTWCFAISFNAYAVFFVSRDQRQDNMQDSFNLCTGSGNRIRVPFKGLSGMFPLSVFLGFFYTLIFLCTIPLYIHMFIVVRKSSTQMGVKREGALARKMGLLVFTNLMFSTIPLSLGPFFSNKKLQSFLLWDLKMYNSLFKVKAFTICTVWVPVLLLCLNSCLNPFLFAFRNHLFKQHFLKTVRVILQYFNKEKIAPADQQVNKQRNRSRVRVKETAL